MITLKQAFRLCGIRDDEVIWLRPKDQSRHWATPYTGQEIRQKKDMKRIKVLRIRILFCFGEAEGFEFEITDESLVKEENVE